MKDSIWGAPFYYDMIVEDMIMAIASQSPYDEALKKDGSLLPRALKMDKVKAFKFLQGCKCCFSHQIKRPKSLKKGNEVSYSFPVNSGKIQKNCKCDCRHLSRWMCRQEK